MPAQETEGDPVRVPRIDLSMRCHQQSLSPLEILQDIWSLGLSWYPFSDILHQ